MHHRLWWTTSSVFNHGHASPTMDYIKCVQSWTCITDYVLHQVCSIMDMHHRLWTPSSVFNHGHASPTMDYIKCVQSWTCITDHGLHIPAWMYFSKFLIEWMTAWFKDGLVMHETTGIYCSWNTSISKKCKQFYCQT